VIRLLGSRRIRRVCLWCAVALEPCVHLAGLLTAQPIPHVEGMTGALLPYLED
jgi:hypothetical protein